MLNNAPPTPKTIEDVREQVPALNKLIDKLNLKIENGAE